LIELSQDVVSHLEFLKLPLKSLSFDAGFNTQQENFNRILEIHAAFLKELSISRGPYSLPFDNLASLAILPKLKSLTLCGPIFSCFNFLSKMPNLNSLSVKYNCKAVNNCVDPDQISNQVLLDYFSLKEIRPELQLYPQNSLIRPRFREVLQSLPENIESFSVEGEAYAGVQIAKLQVIMPRLKSLRVGLGKDGFEMVCRKWKNLETLHVFPYLISEDGLLGVVNGRKYAAPNITDLKREKITNVSGT